jgi:hypothetical protein
MWRSLPSRRHTKPDTDSSLKDLGYVSKLCSMEKLTPTTPRIVQKSCRMKALPDRIMTTTVSMKGSIRIPKILR